MILKKYSKKRCMFLEKRHRSTSFRMLKKELGINQFSIYSSFQSKYKLFVKVLQRYRKHVQEGILQMLIKSNGHLEDIRRFLN